MTMLQNHFESIVDDLNELLAILVNGTEFEIQFITPVGGIQVSFGVSAAALLAAIDAHVATTVEFTKALMACADEKSLEPLIEKTDDLLAGMEQVLDCFRDADISLSYDVGANADIGAEGLATIGAGASVSVGLNPELLLMLVGLDSPDHEGKGSIGIDLSLDIEGGVSVGEFAELAITGGGGVSTNLLSIEVTEWDDDIPTFYEDRSASNANLNDVKVYAGGSPTPLPLTPALDFNNTGYDVWVPFNANSAEFHFRTSMEDTSVWRYLYDTGYEQVRLDKDGSGVARCVLDMTGKDSALLRIGTCSRNGTIKEYRFTVRKAPKTQLASLSVTSNSEELSFTQPFSPDTYRYALNLPTAHNTQVTFTPVLDDPAQTKMTINGTPWSSGTPWTVFTEAGYSPVTIELTPADSRIPAGTQTIGYTVSVHRPVSDDAGLDRIELLGIPEITDGVIWNPVPNHSEDPGDAVATFTVGENVSNITVTAVTNHNGAKVRALLGEEILGVSNHWMTCTIPLDYGSNTIGIVVTAESGKTEMYRLKVTRKTVQLQEGYPALTIDGDAVNLNEIAPNVFVGTVNPGTSGNANVRLEVKPVLYGVQVSVNGDDLMDTFTDLQLPRPIGQYTWVIKCEDEEIDAEQEYVVVLNGSGTDYSRPEIDVKTPGGDSIPLSGSGALYADNVAVDLVQPVTKITIAVVSGDGTNRLLYSVELHKSAAVDYDADASSITVQLGSGPVIDLIALHGADQSWLTLDVENSVETVTIDAEMKQSGTSILITDPSEYNDVTDDLMPQTLRLRPGPNTFVLTARARNSYFRKMYTVTINRALSDDASLLYYDYDAAEYGLELRPKQSDGTVVSVGRPDGYNVDTFLYEMTYPNDITTLGVKAIPYQFVLEEGSLWPPSLTVNGIAVQPGAWIDIPLELGLNTIDITITAPDGETTLTYTVKATRADVDPPVLVLPDTITVEANERQGGVKGARVSFAVSAYDAIDGDVTVTCNPASGSFFSKGSNTVTCTARDRYNNEVTGTFDVVVVDTTPPTITVLEESPLLTAAATGPDGAVVDFSGAVLVEDLGSPVSPEDVTFTREPGSVFPIGSTGVTCIAEDEDGNVAYKTFHVTVTPLPVISEITAVSGISVPFGTSLETAKAALPGTTTIKDSSDQTYTVNLTWTIDGYDGTVAGDYTAVGTFALPDVVAQPVPPVPLQVTANVRVLPADNAFVSPVTVTWDVEAETYADLETVITWNDAALVTGVTCGSVTAVEGIDYTVEAIDGDTSTLTLKKEFIASLGPTYGTDLQIAISFDAGEDVIFTVQVVDTKEPTWENASLTATQVSHSSVTLTWTAATDGGAVTSYRVFKDGQLAGTSTTLQYTVVGLAANTAYTFKVEAGDAAGNWSTDGPDLSVTTAAAPQADENDDVPYTPPATPTTGSGKTDKLVVEGGAQGVDVDVKYDTAAGTASTHIDDEALKKILEAAKSGGGGAGDGEGPAVAKVRIPDVDGVTTYTIGLDASSCPHHQAGYDGAHGQGAGARRQAVAHWFRG